jgi:hypothetical protein
VENPYSHRTGTMTVGIIRAYEGGTLLLLLKAYRHTSWVHRALHQKSGHKNNSFVNESYPSLKNLKKKTF